MIDTDLLWQKRFRGLLPLSPRALADDGTLTFVHPDELETRTYQIVQGNTEGRVRGQGTISVEKLTRTALALGGASLVGATDDDLYLFRDGRKTRLMAGRRVTCTDVALSGDGTRFAVGFADMLFSTHTLALGDVSGRIAWSRDLSLAVNAVAIDAQGRHVAVGVEEGRVLVYDAARTLLYDHLLEQPVAALALAADAPTAAVGTAEGELLGLTADGGRAWHLSLALPIVAVGLTADARVAACLAQDAAGGMLLLVDASGDLLWEHGVEARPTGLSLSPNGRFAAVSLADGRLMVFALGSKLDVGAHGIPHADRPAHASSSELRARQAWEDGRREEACRLLRQALEANPSEAAACEALIRYEAELVGERLLQAETLAVAGDEAALDALRAAEAIDAADGRIAAARASVTGRLVSALSARAATESDPEAAMRLYESVLALDFKNLAARRDLGAARQRRAGLLVAEGEARAAAGDSAGALEAWRQAQLLAPCESLAARLRELDVARIVAEGRRLYEARRYPEAAFQFQKALALDPQNEEAHRYLGYARGLGSDPGVSGRFQRLE
jgi:tetratricopeptide (TPR) repeat protein